MNSRIAITGMGIISALGEGQSSNYDALIGQRSGISKLENLSTVLADRILVGEIKKTNDQLAMSLNIDLSHAYSRTTLLGMHAVKEALQQANLTGNEANLGFISSTTVGGMDTSEKYVLTYSESEENHRFISAHDAGVSTRDIAGFFGIQGFSTTLSTACSSAANAVMLGARMLQSGQLDRVVVGGSDALSKFTINGFNSLMILSDALCAPFDSNRKGLNLGEAAAYIVMESERVLKDQPKKVLAYLSGYGNANDAFHQTASSADGTGAYLAMNKALKSASLSAQDIDYINAHGTATPNNDAAEGTAMRRIFDLNMPKYSSTKAYTGHTLAAAAAVEAVFSILALQHQVVFPNLNFEVLLDELAVPPVLEVEKCTVDHVLSNSFGFGGNCSTLVFSRNE